MRQPIAHEHKVFIAFGLQSSLYQHPFICKLSEGLWFSLENVGSRGELNVLFHF